MLVLDASAALTWCFIDEHSDFGERLLDAVQQGGALVPALWHTEVANLLLASLRHGRLDAAELDHLRTVFDRLPVQTEVLGPEQVRQGVLSLAQRHGLTVYDAAYLDLAQRRGLPLATLDTDLQRAARETGVALIEH